jgi:hypothetical protein
MDPPPVEGELFYTTDTKGLYVGDDEGAANLVSSAVVTVNGYQGAVDLVTDDIPEEVGATNLWFTDDRAQDAVWAALDAGNSFNTGITFSYNDGSGRLSAVVTYPGSGTVNTGTTNSLAYYTGNTNAVDDAAELKWNNVSKILTVNNSQVRLVGVTPIQGVIKSEAYVDGNPFSTASIYTRARGSEATPTAVQAEDFIHADLFQAWDGANYVTSAVVGVKVQSIPGSPGYLPGSVVYSMTDQTGNLVDHTRLDSLGRVVIGPYFPESTGTGTLSVIQTKTANFDPTAIFVNIFGNSLGPNLRFSKSRGTQATYAAVQAGDVLGDLEFFGKDTKTVRDGTEFAQGARIRVEVNGTIGTDIVPAKMTFSVANSSGTLLDIARADNNGLSVLKGALKLPVYATTTARDTDLPSPQAGMLVFIEAGAKIQINTNNTTGGWVDLN